ncbi:hypothetical protein ABII15_29575 [Streptomyces sp. HUAS MG91]|uniref:Uncharacterized protein n=1 Tax=Streptomyces tabacisoli TaxID=3156398 RepID=A0AAU8IZC6_9ACTN
MAGEWNPSQGLRLFFLLYVLLMALLIVTALVLGQWRTGLFSALAALPGIVLCLRYSIRSSKRHP